MEIKTRREFLKMAAGSAAATASMLAGCAEVERLAQKGKTRPNFIFILTDDQRYDAMSCAGNALVRTPNIDSLAARGVRFENAFVTLSICTPCRAACLTGRYGSRNGVMTCGGVSINKDEKTFVRYLREAGYRTGLVGKWDLGNSPAWCGFDFAATFWANGRYYGRAVIENGHNKTANGFIEDYNADQAIRFLEDSSKSQRPFMLWLATQVPHMNHEYDWNPRAETLATYDVHSMVVPETWQDELGGKPPYLKTSRSREQALHYGYDKKENIQRHFKKYYASITDMDAALGLILKAIDDLGLRDNTYIFFMGDNGWFMGEHGFTSKVLPYEESIHVPMIVAGPGIAPKLDDHLVLNIDLAPTMLELAGVSVPRNMHGESIVGLLSNKRTAWRQSLLYEAPSPQLGSWPLWAVRSRRWKYVQTFDINEPTKLVFEELYDLQNDPIELNNVYDNPAYAGIVEELRAELKRLQKQYGASDELRKSFLQK